MLKAIIVDDEAPARSELRFLLDETGEVEVAAEATNVREAIEQLKDVGADIMFLDVNMPGVDGLQLAEALNATDYLVKPVETERLMQAIGKVKQLITAQGRSTTNERIPVEKGGKKLLIPASKIHFIMAKDDYSYLHTENDRYLSTVSLAQLEAKLEPLGFFRVHRRYLVNLACVSEVDPVSGGTLLLTLTGEDEQIPVSRRRVSSLKKALGL